MLEKLNETEGLKQQLESKLDEVLKEIEEAKHRKAALEQSLQEKKCVEHCSPLCKLGRLNV